MQKFTRALTREIEVGGERLAVTLSEEGLSVRVVGTRKTPYSMTWAACLCALTQGREHPPSEEEMAATVKALRAGVKEPAAPAKAEEPGHAAPHAATPEHAAAASTHGHESHGHESHGHAAKGTEAHGHAPQHHPSGG